MSKATNILEQVSRLVVNEDSDSDLQDLSDQIIDLMNDLFGQAFTVSGSSEDDNYSTLHFSPSITSDQAKQLAGELDSALGITGTAASVDTISIPAEGEGDESESKLDEAVKKVVHADGSVSTITVRPHKVKHLKHKRKKLSATAKASMLKKRKAAMAKRKKLGI